MTRANQPASADAAPMPVSLPAVRRLLALALPYRSILALAGILMLISTAISLSIPLITRQALDGILKSRSIQGLDHLGVALIGLILLGAISGYTQYILVAIAGNRVVREMRARVFAHLQRLPVAYFDHVRSGDLASYLSNDVSLLQQSLTDDLVRLVGNVVTLVGGVALAVVIDARLTAVVVLLMVAVSCVFFVFGKRLRKMTRASLDALSEAMGGMTEAMANIRLVKAFAREPYEDARALIGLNRVYALSMKSSALEGAFGTVAFTGFIMVLLGVVWYGGRNVLAGTLSAGSLLAFIMTVAIISNPIGQLAIQYARLQRAVGAADRLFAILDTAPERPDEPEAGAFPDGPGRVEFDDVHFAYVAESDVLRGLTLNVPAGRVTAVVGASGAGKTTIASLLYRFYELDSGQIRVDGRLLEKIRRQALRENIGLVPQEPVLFNGTIRENIRYGRLDATDAEIEQAARVANVEEFVTPLAKGYETVLGERGITLSGGQRQRVAIARAVLKNPRILILDEATSALDTRSEALVKEALDRLMVGRTTLVIAHRLSTIQNAHQIAVIDGGRVAEIGGHEALLRNGGSYASLQGLALVDT